MKSLFSIRFSYLSLLFFLSFIIFLSNIRLKEKWRQAVSVYLQEQLLFLEKVSKLREFSFPQLIVVPLSCHEVDGVRKEKERLTAALSGCYVSLLVITCWFHRG